jgi:hypothetical protein
MIKKLILDPKNFIFIYGVKILSFENTIHFKTNRNEVKDREDLILLKKLNLPMKDQSYKVTFNRILTFKLLRITYKTKIFVFRILKTLRLTWIINILKEKRGL